MTIEAALVAYLEDDMDVAALVDDRIYTRHVLDTPHPMIVYRRVSTRKTMHHDGSGLAGVLFQFNCWATSETESRELRRAVTAAFDVAVTDDFRSFVENEMEVEFAAGRLPYSVVDVRVWYDPASEIAS